MLRKYNDLSKTIAFRYIICYDNENINQRKWYRQVVKQQTKLIGNLYHDE